MEVVVGTYDEVLLGYKIIKVEQPADQLNIVDHVTYGAKMKLHGLVIESSCDHGRTFKEYQFDQSFTDHSHMGCIKALTVSRKGILASGSTDETIRLINLKKRTELGSLIQHSGTVTCLKFHHSSHMFSASEDGTIGIWKYFTWECLKTLRGHTSAVNYISIHPSGKLALSVGRDKTLRTWNLITGRSAYTTNIKQEATQVVWSLNGNHYAVVFATRIDIYNTQTAEVVSTVKTTHRVNDLAFISKTVMVYGGEGGQLYFYDIISKTTLHNVDTQTNRIRQMSVVPAPLEEGEESNENKQWLFIAASDGHIKIFQVQLKEDEVDTVLVASHDTTFRLTCMAVSSFKSKIPDGTNDDSQKHVTEKIFKVTESIDVPQKVVSRDNTAEKSCKKGAAKKLKKSQKTSTKRRAESESEDSGTNVSHDVIDVDSEDSFTPVKAKKVKFTNENVEKEKARKKLKQRKEKKEIVKTKCKAVTQGQPKKKKIKS